MKYGSLEWAQDLLDSTKAELDKINAADEKGKAAAEGLGLTSYYTGLVKALEDEIAKGTYVTENEMPAKDTSDDEDLEEVKTNSLIEDEYTPVDYATAVKLREKNIPVETKLYTGEWYNTKPGTDDLEIIRDYNGKMRVKKTVLKDIDGDGDIDKIEATKISPNILGGVKDFGN